MAKGYYEVGRQVLAKPVLGGHWVPAVVVQSRPLRVQYQRGFLTGAIQVPARIKVAKHRQKRYDVSA